MSEMIDTFVTGVGKIESVSTTCNRYYFYIWQGSERVTVAKLIIPTDCLNQMVAALQAGAAVH